MDCSGVAARDILSLFLSLLSATLHSWRCLYTIYLHPRPYFISIWLSLVCFLIFPCQSPLPHSPETRLPSHRFLYFSNLNLFLFSTILSTHVSLLVFHTIFYSTVNILPVFYLSIFTFWAILFSTCFLSPFVFVYQLYFVSIVGIRTSGRAGSFITITSHETNKRTSKATL